jgi:hypothetical protein
MLDRWTSEQRAIERRARPAAPKLEPLPAGVRAPAVTVSPDEDGDEW